MIELTDIKAIVRHFFDAKRKIQKEIDDAWVEELHPDPKKQTEISKELNKNVGIIIKTIIANLTQEQWDGVVERRRVDNGKHHE